MSVPQSTTRLDLRVSKTCDPNRCTKTMDLKTSLVKDHHRCFCANLSWLPPSAKRSKSYTARRRKTLEPCGSTFLRGLVQRLRRAITGFATFRFFLHTISLLPFLFARSFVVGLGTRAPRSAVPKSLSVSQSLSASPNFFFTSQTIRFFGPFFEGPARLLAPTLVSFRSMQHSLLKCSLSATTAVSTCIRHWSRDMQRCRDNRVPWLALQFPRMEFASVATTSINSSLEFVSLPPSQTFGRLLSANKYFYHVCLFWANGVSDTRQKEHVGKLKLCTKSLSCYDPGLD